MATASTSSGGGSSSRPQVMDGANWSTVSVPDDNFHHSFLHGPPSKSMLEPSANEGIPAKDLVEGAGVSGGFKPAWTYVQLTKSTMVPPTRDMITYHVPTGTWSIGGDTVRATFELGLGQIAITRTTFPDDVVAFIALPSASAIVPPGSVVLCRTIAPEEEDGVYGAHAEDDEYTANIKASAKRHYAEGRFLLKSKSYDEAIEKLSDALGALTGLYGETSLESAEAYHYYGMALLAKAESDPNMFVDPSGGGGGGKDADEEIDEDDPILGRGSAEGDVEDAAESDSKGKGPATAAGSSSSAGAAAGAGGDDEADKKEDDDLNLSWKVLQIARSIYAACGMAKGKELAEIHMLLGDVALNVEDYPEAASNYLKGIKLREKFLEPTNRKLADGHYLLVLPLQALGHLQEAMGHLDAALKVLRARREMLLAGSGDVKGKGKAAAGAPSASGNAAASTSGSDAEIADVDGLIKDMQAKMEELKETENSQNAMPPPVALPAGPEAGAGTGLGFSMKEVMFGGSAPAGGVTSTGFGAPSSSSSSSGASSSSSSAAAGPSKVGTTTTGFGAPSSSAAASAAPVHNLGVIGGSASGTKRRVALTSVAASQPNSGGDGAPDAKKAKLG